MPPPLLMNAVTPCRTRPTCELSSPHYRMPVVTQNILGTIQYMITPEWPTAQKMTC